MDYLHHHLLRLDSCKDILADGLLLYVVAELLGYLVTYIGIQEGPADFLQGLGNIYFGDFAFTFEYLE